MNSLVPSGHEKCGLETRLAHEALTAHSHTPSIHLNLLLHPFLYSQAQASIKYVYDNILEITESVAVILRL